MGETNLKDTNNQKSSLGETYINNPKQNYRSRRQSQSLSVDTFQNIFIAISLIRKMTKD